jgi:hypothetical protein
MSGGTAYLIDALLCGQGLLLRLGCAILGAVWMYGLVLWLLGHFKGGVGELLRIPL